MSSILEMLRLRSASTSPDDGTSNKNDEGSTTHDCDSVISKTAEFKSMRTAAMRELEIAYERLSEPKKDHIEYGLKKITKIMEDAWAFTKQNPGANLIPTLCEYIRYESAMFV